MLTDPKKRNKYIPFSYNDYTEMYKIVKESIEHKLKYRCDKAYELFESGVVFRENPALENFKAIIEPLRECANIIKELGDELHQRELVTSSEIFQEATEDNKQASYIFQKRIEEYCESTEKVTIEHEDKLKAIDLDFGFFCSSVELKIDIFCQFHYTVYEYFDPDVELPEPITSIIPLSHVTDPKRLKRSLNLEPMEVS